VTNSDTSAAPAPQDGDFIVTRETKSIVRYSVRQLPGDVQFSASFPEEAVRIARVLARKQGVNLWYSENGSARLLQTYRGQSAEGAPDAKGL
jgi:hypothetical protein